MQRHFRVLVALLVGLLTVACGQPTPSGAPTSAAETPLAPISFRMGHTAAAGSLLQTDSLEFVGELRRRTGGAAVGTVHPNGELANQQELVERLQLGELDIALSSSALVGAVPEFAFFDLPFAFQNRDEVQRVVKGPLGEELGAKADKHNLVLLAYWENGFRHVTNNVRPIRHPSDLSGLRLRTPPDPARVELFHMWGARPAPLDLTLLFDALKSETFDGQENPVSLITSQRYFEVQRYVSLTGHIYSPTYVLASRRWWESLDPRVQQTMLEIATTTGDNSRRRGEEMDRDAVAKLTALGMQVNDDVDKVAFERTVAPVYAKYEKSFGPRMLQLLEAATGRSASSAPDVVG